MKEYYVPGIVREVCGYSTIADDDGENLLEVRYDLKPIDLVFLQKLFNIDPNDPDPGTTDLIDCYDINEEQAKKLQPYVIGGFLMTLKNTILCCNAIRKELNFRKIKKAMCVKIG